MNRLQVIAALRRVVTLASSPTRRALATSSEERVDITFVTAAGDRYKTHGKVGQSLLDVVVDRDVPLDGFGKKALSVYIDNMRFSAGACEGTIACSTCHVHVPQELYDRLEPPGEEELDMLDLAFDLADNSRLGCLTKKRCNRRRLEVSRCTFKLRFVPLLQHFNGQIILDKSMEGTEFLVPESTRDARTL